MLFIHGQVAASPRFAHHAREGGDHVDGERFQAQHGQRLAQGIAQFRHLVATAQRQVVFKLGGRRWRRRAAGAGQLLQLHGAVLHDFARTKSEVQQALDHAQLLHLLGRIAALAKGVALGLGKGVAALPDTQGFLGQPGVALDIADAEGGSRLQVSIHTRGALLACKRTWHAFYAFRCPVPNS
ncbi:hypothetical protein D3C81_255030 [compost metagenome]